MARRNVAITFQPLTQWPAGRERTPAEAREVAKFRTPGYAENSGTPNYRYVGPKAITLDRTLDDLDRELWHIGAQNVVVQVDVENDRNFRQDGGIRADARTRSPAIVVSFTRNRVATTFATDHFKRWEDNLRAIALGMETLRKLERYHIARAGDQYRGWQALPAPGNTTVTMSVEAAAGVISSFSEFSGVQVIVDREGAKNAIRTAVNRTHPDKNAGDRKYFDEVATAKRVLEAHHGGSL